MKKIERNGEDIYKENEGKRTSTNKRRKCNRKYNYEKGREYMQEKLTAMKEDGRKKEKCMKTGKGKIY